MTPPRPASPDPGDPTAGPDDVGDLLRYLAEVDDGPVAGATGPASSVGIRALDGGLDDRTAALARVAALVALQAAPASYARAVDLALASGATVDDVLSTLEVVGRSVGLARLVSAAPGLALALGYDVDDALETLEDPARAARSGPMSGGR